MERILAQLVSVIITTLNEEENIGKCVESVRWADEILIIDSGSGDKTLEIAKAAGAKIFSHPYENAAAQKNWAHQFAKNDWILFVDADEQVSAGLKSKIENVLSGEPGYAGYRIKRCTTFMGRRIKHCGWERDYVLRLFRKSCGKYQDRRVHADVVLDGAAGVIEEPLLHNTYANFSQYYIKFDRYTTWSAQDLFDAGKKPGFSNLFLRPMFRFFKQYILRLGFLDGKEGLILCSLSAYSVFLRYVKLYEMRKNAKRG